MILLVAASSSYCFLLLLLLLFACLLLLLLLLFSGEGWFVWGFLFGWLVLVFSLKCGLIYPKLASVPCCVPEDGIEHLVLLPLPWAPRSLACAIDLSYLLVLSLWCMYTTHCISSPSYALLCSSTLVTPNPSLQVPRCFVLHRY